MTDEEKAEEYKKSKRLHCIPKERYVIEAQESRLAEIKQAFLAGLKAGRPQWHKVVDGDLPKNENDVLVYSGEDWRKCVGMYSPKHKAWEAGCDAIAWCEIPEVPNNLKGN